MEDEGALEQALARRQVVLTHLRTGKTQLERFRVRLKQTLLASALVADELAWPLSDEAVTTRAHRSSSDLKHFRHVVDEIEVATHWTPEFGDETLDDALLRRIADLRTRIAELEDLEPAIQTHAQLRTDLEQIRAKLLRSGPASSGGATSFSSFVLLSPNRRIGSDEPSEVDLKAHSLSLQLARKTATLIEDLRAQESEARERAEDDVEFVRTTVQHFFHAGLQVLQTPRRVSASAYDEADGTTADIRLSTLEDVPLDNDASSNQDKDDAVVRRSLPEFRATRKLVRYQYPSGSSPSPSTQPTLPTLKLPTMEAVVSFTTKHLPWTAPKTSSAAS